MTLDYNVNYSATIAAVNCAGRSNQVFLSNIEFGNILYFHRKSIRIIMCMYILLN